MLILKGNSVQESNINGFVKKVRSLFWCFILHTCNGIVTSACITKSLWYKQIVQKDHFSTILHLFSWAPLVAAVSNSYHTSLNVYLSELKRDISTSQYKGV